MIGVTAAAPAVSICDTISTLVGSNGLLLKCSFSIPLPPLLRL